MPKFNKRFRHSSNFIKELCQATALESTIRLYESLNLDKQISYSTFSRSLSCKVDLRPLGSQYGINVDPVKGYFIVWREIGCHINFIIPIGSKEETQEDLSKLLQEADDLLSSV